MALLVCVGAGQFLKEKAPNAEERSEQKSFLHSPALAFTFVNLNQRR
jgi:hypothetical protein